MFHLKSCIHVVPAVSIALSLFLTMVSTPDCAQIYTSVFPFESITLSGQQVLLGETQGKPVTLAGELRLPIVGSNKVPVVILVHGMAGLWSKYFEWANTLNSWGFGVFIPDHISGRNIRPLSPEDYGLSPEARMVDIYQVLPQLTKHPRIDPERIAIMGFSRGGYVTMLSSQERFRKRYGLPNVQFAAYIAVYSFCSTRLRDDVNVSDRPIRLFHGTADDWTPVEACRLWVADLKKAGADVTLTEYPGATHDYDNPEVKVRLNLPQAVSPRKCSLAEGEGGQILNAQTGKLFTSSDPCLEKGVSLQYDEAATASTREAVKGVLTSAFATKPAAAAPTTAKTMAASPSMPNDVQMVQPDPSLPKELAAFWGKWEGSGHDSGVQKQIQYFLIVEKISEEKASLYTWHSVHGWFWREANITKENGKYKLWYMGNFGKNEITPRGEELVFDAQPGWFTINLRRVP
jgi:dienelactone hydrolase